MPVTWPPVHRAASLVFGLTLAAAVLKLAACSAIDPTPPHPHDQEDPSIDPPDASDASALSDAAEEP